MLAVAGDSAMWSRGPAVTVRLAVPVFPPSVPVTVWAPATVALQLAPVHAPVGADGEGGGPRHVTEGVVVGVGPGGGVGLRSPGPDARRGRRQRDASRGPAVTVRLAVAGLTPSVPVTVWAPATVALQLAPVQLPSGAMVKVVAPVTSPRELL